MKYILLVLTFVLALNINAQEVEENTAVSYMKQIDANYTQLSIDMWEYMRAVAHSRKATKIERKRQELIETADRARLAVKKTGDFEGNVLVWAITA